MRKKSLTVVLILSILILAAGSAYSNWGPKKYEFGPIVIQGHPWGESTHSNNGTYAPPGYRPGAGAGFQDLVTTIITNFTVQFYLKYVVKGKKDGQSSIRYNNRSE